MFDFTLPPPIYIPERPAVVAERPSIIKPPVEMTFPIAGRSIGKRVDPIFVGMTGSFASDPYTISGVDVGPGGGTVHLGISWAASQNRTLNTVRLNGANLSRDGRALEATAASNFEWWSIRTDLTSGDIFLDWSGGIAGAIVAVFWSPRKGTLTKNVGSFSNVNNGTVLTTTVNAYAGGYILAGARWSDRDATTVWTGATEVFETGTREAVAMETRSPANAARVVEVTTSTTTDFRRLCALAVR